MNRQISSQIPSDKSGQPIHSITDFLSHTRNTLLETQEQIRRATDVLAQSQKLLGSATEIAATGKWGQAPDVQSSNPPQIASASPPEQASANLGRPVVQLKIYTLGNFRVCLGQREVERWHSNKAKGILKLLVTHLGHPLPKDVFIEALWPDQPAQPANSSFRVALHQLRQTLGQLEDSSPSCQYLRSDGSNHFLDCNNPGLPVWVDVVEFKSRWQAGRALERAGRHSEAITEYILAEELYRGDFLEEDIYDDWTTIPREALVDVYLSLLGKVTAYYLKSSDYETCIEFCQRILDRDSCREDAYQDLMYCYGKLGQRSRAVRWYELCRETLHRELECDVSPQTTDLYRKIKDGGGF